MQAYGSDAGLDAYVTATGKTLPSGDKTAARLRGSMSLDAVYSARWIGQKASYTQDRDWPRVDAQWPDGTAVSGVPSQVEYAAYEYTYQELRSPGSTAPIITPGKTKVRARVEGAVDVEYARDRSNQDLVASMTPINLTVEGLLHDLVGLRVPSPAALVV